MWQLLLLFAVLSFWHSYSEDYTLIGPYEKWLATNSLQLQSDKYTCSDHVNYLLLLHLLSAMHDRNQEKQGLEVKMPF